FHGSSIQAVVVSIDIRRSTDLMLKARTPNKYSDFITELSAKLSQIIIENYGIFDKFTGDGILAFFPDFYSGKDAIHRALISAEHCHKAFIDLYNKNKKMFSVFIKGIGLGIGIDAGEVSLVNTGTELTVVGRPVVYACRFSGAKAGETILNIEAEELLSSSPKKITRDIIEKEIEIKNEGTALAYLPVLDHNYTAILDIPDWANNNSEPVDKAQLENTEQIENRS